VTSISGSFTVPDWKSGTASSKLKVAAVLYANLKSIKDEVGVQITTTRQERYATYCVLLATL
jgi:hypothetical protein